jgi:hypothetical protein
MSFSVTSICLQLYLIIGFVTSFTWQRNLIIKCLLERPIVILNIPVAGHSNGHPLVIVSLIVLYVDLMYVCICSTGHVNVQSVVFHSALTLL